MAAVRVSSRPSLLVSSSYLFYCCFLMPAIHFRRASSLSFKLSFSQPQSPNVRVLINCTGDATIDGESLWLTRSRYNQVTTSSVGRAQYVEAVPLWDRASGEMASFTTTFYFNISLDDKSGGGDGLAFFLAPPQSSIPQNSIGGALGLLPRDSKDWNSTAGAGDDRRIVAVEFDTVQNLEYADTNNDHIGIDVNSLISRASTTNTTFPQLTSNFVKMATVRYDNVTKLLLVDLKINGQSYNVNTMVDLRSYLPENVVVGFSAATGGLGELNQILSWSFSSTLKSKDDKHPQRLVLLIYVLVPLLFFLVCAAVLGFLIWGKHKRRRSGVIPNASSDSDDDYEHQQDDDRAELERGVAASSPRRYAYRQLAAATSNFAEEEKLGRGGFGSVYRGTLAVGGQDWPVAIKMFSSESSAQGRKEFEAEVRIISQLKHRNLVQLLGWCDSRNGLLLVYELVAKGSLDRHLHSSDSESFLTWPQR